LYHNNTGYVLEPDVAEYRSYLHPGCPGRDEQWVLATFEHVIQTGGPVVLEHAASATAERIKSSAMVLILY
jgi:hypothetical protein